MSEAPTASAGMTETLNKLIKLWRHRANLNTGEYRKIGIAQQQCAMELSSALAGTAAIPAMLPDSGSGSAIGDAATSVPNVADSGRSSALAGIAPIMPDQPFASGTNAVPVIHADECELSHGQTMRGDYTPTTCTCGAGIARPHSLDYDLPQGSDQREVFTRGAAAGIAPSTQEMDFAELASKLSKYLEGTIEYTNKIISEKPIAPLYAVLAALEALAAPPEGWQDISTAPKDGTPVLVFDDGAIAIAGWAEGSWWDHSEMTPPPAHWMPLPDPPASRSGEPEPEPK